MILFRPEHVTPILEGHKTQTRRMGQKRWNVDAVHQCRTKIFGGEPFAHVRILDVRRERLGAISTTDVRAEGYATRVEFLGAFVAINVDKAQTLREDAYVWVVEFELVRQAA